MNTIKKIQIVLILTLALIFAGCSEKKEQNNISAPSTENIKVNSENFIRAETDNMFSAMIANAGGTNKFFHFRQPTPLDKQTVIRMNRDVLYSGGVFDAAEGLSIVFPEITDQRYATVEIIDNDHYVVQILDEPGTYAIETPSEFVYVIVRIQLKSPDDKADIQAVNQLQDKFVVNTKSKREFVANNWDKTSLDALRKVYLEDAENYDGFKGMMGKRGEVDEKTRHIAAASGWGLLPDEEATYLLFQDDTLDPSKSYSATFEVPENNGFWSITLYGEDGYIKNNQSYLAGSNAVFNDDGTFTVCFGNESNCGDSPNQLETPEGWNFLLRIYSPGESVLNGDYVLPKLKAN